MSKARMEQSWQRIKAQIQSVWGHIDDHQLKKARGNLHQMVDVIHKQTGEDRLTIQTKMLTVL